VLDTANIVGQVPINVLHDSTRAAVYPARSIPSADHLRVTDVFPQIARLLLGEYHSTSRGALAALGLRLSDLASSPVDLRDLLLSAALAVKMERLERCERLLGQESRSSVRFLTAVLRYKSRLHRSMKCGSWWLPVELRSPNTLTAASGYFALLGDSLQLWPELWAWARQGGGLRGVV
jgi:hypothetical protein